MANQFPNLNSVQLPSPMTISDANGGNTVTLDKVSEPRILPVMNAKGRPKSWFMRPSASGPGNRVWWDPGANASYRTATFRSGLIRPADRTKLQTINETRPRACRWFDGTDTWLCKLPEDGIVQGNYPFNLNGFGWAEFKLEVLGAL